MKRRYRPLFTNSQGTVYLGDYLETAIFYTQRLVDQALREEGIDKVDQPAMPYWTRGVKLVPVEYPNLALNAASLRTKVKFNYEVVNDLWGNYDTKLYGLQKKHVTRYIMEKIITLAMVVLSLEETYEVSVPRESRKVGKEGKESSEREEVDEVDKGEEVDEGEESEVSERSEWRTTPRVGRKNGPGLRLDFDVLCNTHGKKELVIYYSRIRMSVSGLCI